MFFLLALLYMQIGYGFFQPHSYSIEIDSYQKPKFYSEFDSNVDRLEVYKILYSIGVVSPSNVPPDIQDAWPLPSRPNPLPLRYLEYPYYDFAQRKMIMLTLKITYV